MKKYVSRIVTLIIIISFFACIPVVKSMAQETGKPAGKKAAASSVKQLEDVLFEKLPGRERISLLVSEQPEIRAEGQTNGSLLVKLEDTSTPEKLRRNLGEGQLSNILRVIPSELTINDKQWTYLTIDIRDLVPYSIRKENNRILIDFNISGLPQRKPPAPVIAAAPPEKKEEVIPEKEVVEKAKPHPVVAPVAPPPPRPEIKPIIPKPARYTERKISVDFQEADIKSVLRLMAEYGQVSIVSGDDVRGNVTLSMRNVPWDQALETILSVQGLVKEEAGNVVTVMTLAKSRQEATQREAYEKKDRERKAEQGLLKQILIEAKIVEVTDDFARNLGIDWRFAYSDPRAGSENRAFGSAGGTGSGGSSVWSETGAPWNAPSINLPSLAAGPAIGLVFGGTYAVLDAQLRAMEINSQGKIISAPKIVTMEGMPASIKQGQEVPYVTRNQDGTNIQFKEALLKLEVTPRITPEGKISVSLTASNDYPDWSKTNIANENPPIVKNEVVSQLVIDDNDTIVIGGVLVEQETKSDSGLPWLQKIPVLGFLFKSELKSNEKRQLLIFVTPKILDGDSVAQSAGRTIN